VWRKNTHEKTFSSGFMKLDDRWKIYELMAQHKYISSYSSASYSTKLEKSEKIVITNVEKILKKNISPKDFKNIESEVFDFLYKEKMEHRWGHVPLLGPIKSTHIDEVHNLLDLEDIEEVYVNAENFSGSIKSKKCGWIAWKLVEGDKSILTPKHLTSEYQYLVAMNHHKIETATTEVIEKFTKYKNTKEGRIFKRFYSSRFWYHDDLEKLLTSLPSVSFFNY